MLKKFSLVIAVLFCTTLVWGDIDEFLGVSTVDEYLGISTIGEVLGQTVASEAPSLPNLMYENFEGGSSTFENAPSIVFLFQPSETSFCTIWFLVYPQLSSLWI